MSISSDRLRRVLDDDGCLRVLALDHRDSLRVEFDAEHPERVAAELLTDFKKDVLEGFTSLPSGVMLEPEFSIPQLMSAVDPTVGVICALEDQGYFADPEAGNQMLANWSPQKAVDAGAAAGKILVLYRPDRGEGTERQERFMTEAIEACRAVELPLFIEPVPFDVTSPDDRLACVVAAATAVREMAPGGAVVLKAPFPGSAGQSAHAWTEACASLDEACGSVPWATLSWGVDIDTFARQLEIACANGCSGFMAGRAVWRPALPAEERAAAIAAEVIPRFTRLAEVSATAPSVFARTSHRDTSHHRGAP